MASPPAAFADCCAVRQEGKSMEQEALYTIGQVSKICDVSQRMLRYYEKWG